VPELPPEVPPEYADAYLQGYERAYAEATGEAFVVPPAEEAPGLVERDPEQSEQQAEPWRFEPPEDRSEWEHEPSPTWEFEPPGKPSDDEDDPEDTGNGDGDDQADTAEHDTAEHDTVDPDDAPGPGVPGFVLWEGRDERYDEPPDVEGYPRWVMPFLAVCLIVLLAVAIYLLA
jgi:hypothetical protein